MFWKKTDDKRLDDGDRAKDDGGGSCNYDNNDEAKSSKSQQTTSNHEQQQHTTQLMLPPPSLSPSKRSVHIMNVTSGLCADPIHLHSFKSISSNGWVPSPTSFFVGAFHKCGACHGRLGGSSATSTDIAKTNAEEEGGSSCCTSNDIMHSSSSTSSSGMLHCVACGIYAHRTCAFVSRGNNRNFSSSLLPICEVNLVEIQKAFGLSREQIIDQLGIYSKAPQSNTANTKTETRSSSWSIFGKRSLTDAEQQAIIKENEEKMLEDKKDAIMPKKEEQSTTIQQQQPGVIQTSLNLIQKTTDTSKNIPRASAIGLVAGGAAGLVIAGPAGVAVGSQIGRTVLAVGAAVEGGVGISVLVMSLAAAANYSPNFTLPSSASSKEKERELKLNSTLILVRPDIAVDPIWGEYAKEARELWGQKYHNDPLSSSSSSNQFSLGNLFNSNESAPDERSLRYRKDSDIVKADSSELALREKVFLLVNRILNDKTSLPGYQYRYLILKHKRRTMFGVDEDDTVTDKSAEKDESTEQRSCRQDAHGVIKHVTATLLEVRPGLASSPNMTELTASAVEVLIFGELYDDCFGEIIKETEDRDENLLAKVKELQRICDDADDSNNDTSLVDGVNNNDEISSSVSQLAIGALRALPQAHTPTDKLLHCVEFLEYVSEHFSSSFQGKCIDADTLLIMVCQHVVAAKIKHLHAEVAFIEEFSRDEQLLSGKEGYALITLQASLHYLDGVDEFCSILSSKILAKGDNERR